VPVATLPYAGVAARELAAAGAALPLDAWVGAAQAGVPVLHGRDVVLSPPRLSDRAELDGVLATPEVARWWLGAEVHDLLADARVATWTVQAGDAVVGLVQAWEEPDPEYRHAGIDIALHPRAHGRGLGADTVRTVARHLLEDRNHHRLVIDPAADNAVAIRCYERVGFRPIGIQRRAEADGHGGWRDSLLMDLLPGELT
jgi:aminoglycoside 6'-N-acetyltransferase